MTAEPLSQDALSSEDRTPKSPPATGPRTPRNPPCIGCVRAAIAGKGEGGRCFESDSSRSQRCFSCKTGNHPCRPCPAVMVPIARRLLMALDADHRKMYDRCRLALRLQLDLLAEENSVYSSADAAPGAAPLPVVEEGEDDAARRLRAKRLIKEGIDLL